MEKLSPVERGQKFRHFTTCNSEKTGFCGHRLTVRLVHDMSCLLIQQMTTVFCHCLSGTCLFMSGIAQNISLLTPQGDSSTGTMMRLGSTKRVSTLPSLQYWPSDVR